MPKLSFLVIFSLTVVAGCTSKKEEKQGFHFTSLSPSESGIDFENTITESDNLNLLIHEYAYMGGGVGMGDFDNDGLQDVFFTASQNSSKLYHNKGSMHFEDITQKAGLQTNAWCTGVSVVDINHDGWQDIYVCVSGVIPGESRKNLLFINQHDLSFKEEATSYNLADTSYSTQAAFFDYDKDGDLDMYLMNLRLIGGARNTIVPRVTSRTVPSDVLYRNEGTPAGMNHPVYKDVNAEAGINDNGYGLGLAISDLNGDSYPDIYVANDYLSNDLMWLNNKNGTFTNSIASALRHQSYSSMGTDIADYNNDGLPDIATLDMQPETNERKKMMFSFLTDVRYKLEKDAGYEPQFIRNMLQLNNGVRQIHGTHEPFFSEIGQMAGMSQTDWSWSLLMTDFDNDGWKDMYITNGMGRDLINADFVQYRQEPAFGPNENDMLTQRRNLMAKLASYGSVPMQNYFYHNKGDLTFEDLSTTIGVTEKNISNGAAYADLDNDGDLDLVVNNINSKASILQNNVNTVSGRHHISLVLKGDSLNRQGFGAKIFVHSGMSTQFFEQNPVRGFLSSVDQRIHIGFEKDQPDSIVIRWPDEKYQTLVKPAIDTLLIVDKANALDKTISIPDTTISAFIDITTQLKLPYGHKESFFYDYGFQTLLPQKYSQEGPFISTGDLNGDKLEDFFIGGGYSQSGKLFFQQANGSYLAKDLVAGEKNEEDMQSLFLDADGDNDLDIFIASGSSEFDANSPFYKPRLYINDGKGNFTNDLAAIPVNVNTPAKCIAGTDIDSDGDIDIFLGGRVMVGNYPRSPRSFLLRNDGGKFTDITPPILQLPGLLNAAAWVDIDNDKIPELILAGDWMPIRIFKNVAVSPVEITEASGTQQAGGMWRSLSATDIDDDGDMDLLAGNLGINNPYRISAQQPAKLIAYDFDGNGVIEPIFCYYILNNNLKYEESVGITRDQWASQAPVIKKRFDQNQPFASASMNQIITAEQMKEATILTCNEVHSGYFENDGKGHFTFHPFSMAAQEAPVNSILSTDVDGDGKKDILLAGNEYEYNAAIGRMDASYGLWMKGNGKGEFTPVRPVQSGWITDGDVKDLKFVDNKKLGRLMLVARNSVSLQVLQIKRN